MSNEKLEKLIKNENVLDILEQRGYISHVVHEDELREELEKEQISFYIGIDPTADSLHIGHLKSLIVASYLQAAGHRPIILVGGGTGQIGDPSDRNDMRKVLTKEELQHNVDAIKQQLTRFISFEGDRPAIMVDNAEWLNELKLLEYMRDIGIHFNINRMLESESYKKRLDSGLTLFEITYRGLQAYDYLYLYKKYNCKLQFGGNDQWPNILAGVELINKKENKKVHALAVKLLLKKDGTKMGKTAGGALWLDKEKLSPYNFYQYWVSIDDAEVEDVLKSLTYLPFEEIEELLKLEGKEINRAKKIAAYEITKLVHGEEEAEKARETSENIFEKEIIVEGLPEIDANIGENIIDICIKAGFGNSRSEIKKLMKQNGIRLNDEIINDLGKKLEEKDKVDGEDYCIIKKGKKTYYRVNIRV